MARSGSQCIARNLWNPKDHNRVSNSQMNPVHTLQLCFLKFCFSTVARDFFCVVLNGTSSVTDGEFLNRPNVRFPRQVTNENISHCLKVLLLILSRGHQRNRVSQNENVILRSQVTGCLSRDVGKCYESPK